MPPLLTISEKPVASGTILTPRRLRQLPGWLLLGLLATMPLVVNAQEDPSSGVAAESPPTIPPPAPPGSRTVPPAPIGVPTRPAAPSPSAGAVSNAPATGLRPGEMMFNFQEADIQAVVKTVSQITGKNFLLDPRVRGKLTIISTQPVSKKAIYQIFLASLKAQGFTAIQSASGFVKLVPLGDAKQHADVTTGPAPRPGEQTITHVITVQYSSAAQLVPLLRPLMAPTSQLSVYPPANTLIITDYADNIRNLLRIVEIIDQRGGSEMAIIPLKHASALEIADMVVRLYPNATQSTGAPVAAPAQAAVGEADRVTILPDLRTNSLLVRAESQGPINDLRAFVERLDVPAKISGNTRVVYLRNADAVKLAEILRGLLSGEARAQTTAAAVPGRPAPAARTGAETSQIQADEATNSLIISASDAVFNNLRAVIEKLDVRRAQVFIEALIAEITTDKATQLGVQWSVADQKSGGSVGAITNFPASGSSIVSTSINPANLASAGGLTLGFVGETITVDGRQIRGLGALARALEEKNIANIMSTPNLLTLDNAEAKIVVGQNVPFLTGSFSQATATTGAVNPFQTIERKDVGLTLKIKPQISEGGSVKLQIFQESSTVARATVAAQDLITNKRSLETTVVVDDGNTVVLGGLIEDSQSDNTQAVPLLGRIPLLGWLFKSNETKKTKTNLMVFLRPIIVRGAEDSYGFTRSRYEHIRAAEKAVIKTPSPLLEGFKPAVPSATPEKRTPEEIPEGKIFGPPDVTPPVSRSDHVEP